MEKSRAEGKTEAERERAKAAERDAKAAEEIATLRVVNAACGKRITRDKKEVVGRIVLDVRWRRSGATGVRARLSLMRIRAMRRGARFTSPIRSQPLPLPDVSLLRSDIFCSSARVESVRFGLTRLCVPPHSPPICSSPPHLIPPNPT